MAALGVRAVELGSVRLPAAHPRAADGRCVIRSFLIEHPDGLILVDTGVGRGHPVIDELYAPEVDDLVAALHRHDVDERDVVLVVNSHLHFDHCGQNDRFPGVPVAVTAEEVEAATEDFYTVPEWAHLEPGRRRLVVDGEELAPGVTVAHTPGHTPGHLSVVVDTPAGRVLVAGQCCHTAEEFDAGSPALGDMHTEEWHGHGVASLARLRALGPARLLLAHDARTI